ncbi:hypothetical protein [Polyangium sorediatum]|uniref:DUF2314 domain-containing protein n=1 Tax=Polyangium sorediatum TaxID=889274 RepID=A0ABT6P103_9BACT|nr:hypothetical protein [Polyangium sorediatum]MDI1434292.1 hypothetical protein [Polyangium sorediatum]
MITVAKIWFDGLALLGDPRAVLESIGCGPDVAKIADAPVGERVDVWVTLDVTDERLSKLLALLQERGAKWRDIRSDRFAEEEIEAAPLLTMWFNFDDTVFGGPRMGTTYDMSEACKRCGAGARQTSAMIIDGQDLHNLEGRRAAATPYDDMLVDEKLAKVLAESGATGISFRGVFVAFAKRGHMQLPWRQLCAAHTMPPMSPRSTAIKPYNPCSCRRTGFETPWEIPVRVVYRASDLADIHDVNVTWEWFGDTHYEGDVSDALFASPWFLVTPKVRRIFLDAGVTDFSWRPIYVVDE